MISLHEARPQQDAEAIGRIDTSFSTSSVFRVETGVDSITLRPQTLTGPITKRLPLDDLEDRGRAWTTSWVALDGERVCSFAAVARQTWNARLTLWRLYVNPPPAARVSAGRWWSG